MVDTTQTTTEKKLTQSDIRGVFLRSNLFQGSWNFECIDSLEVRKKPGGHWIIRDLAGLDLVGLASQ